MKLVIKAAATLAACALVVVLSGCNTTKGFGKDIEGAGAGIKHSAEKNGAD